MKRVVFYGRYSSNNQTEQSIEGQLHVCEAYAQQNGMQITAHYIDRAMTGKSDKRPEFQRMIADSKKGNFEMVLVYKLDRFSRNRYDSALYKKKLRDNGVRVVSATENISDTPEGIMLEGFMESINAYFSEELSQKVNRGLAESFHKGHYLKKIPPFGYRIIDKKLAVDESTSQFAAEIFERYNKGQRIVDIVKWLNDLGMTNQAGNPWRPMNISTHLHNRTYMGEYYYGQFEEPMPVPALVSEELFQSVQEKLQESAKRSRKRTDYNFILTGKLICGICGHSVSGSTSNEKNHYYYCRHCTKENRHCIPADYLHQKVSDALSEYLTGEKVEELASAAYKAYQKEQIKDERPALEKELKDVEKKLQNAVNAILQGVDALILKNTMTELEERRDRLRNAVMASPASMPELKKEYFTFILRKMADENSENLLNIIVNHIILHENSVIICINLTDETNLPPLEKILFSVSEAEGQGFKSSRRNQKSSQTRCLRGYFFVHMNKNMIPYPYHTLTGFRYGLILIDLQRFFRVIRIFIIKCGA